MTTPVFTSFIPAVNADTHKFWACLYIVDSEDEETFTELKCFDRDWEAAEAYAAQLTAGGAA
jgi:hypothetical protein